MILIFGGANQGKLAFVRRRWQLAESDIFYCHDCTEPDFSQKAISGLHLFLLAKVRAGESCKDWLQTALPALRDKIVLCDDVSGGIVPLDADIRLWREENGRALAFLAGNADEVYRLFCGLEARLK